ERKEIGILCKVETQKEENLTKDFYRDCYYIDKNGVIFEEAPQTSGTLILVIKDYSGEKAEMGKSILEKGLVAELVDLRNYLFEQLNLKVVDFAIQSKSSKDIRIDTHEGWYILFDSSRDFKKQVEALRLILERKIKGDRNNLEYVDLRIENRVYYK
ncbi:MAG: cell division protein FtsQ/DivIB, partial [Acidobacteriota bacterium]|nr:cell division protein FtsQ/DivIB [Acidobacteriota bacterium]